MQLVEAKVMVQPCGMGEIGIGFVIGLKCLSFIIQKTSYFLTIAIAMH